MPRQPNNPPRLDSVTRDDLGRLVHSPRTPAALYRRALAIWLLVDGVGPCEVAKLTRLHRVNVFRWAQRFRDHGIAGLNDVMRVRKVQPQSVAALNSERPEIPRESSFAAMMRQLKVWNAIYGED